MPFVLPQPILQLLNTAHHEQLKIVLVTGVFDLLHQEHCIFLEKAKQAGDILLVGVESDVRVKKLKGEDRPLWSQEKRMTELSKLPIVDAVFLLPAEFDTPTAHEELIRLIRPTVLAVSSHSPHLEKKSAILKKYGGKVQIVHQFNPAVSTTQLIEKQKHF